MERRWFCVLFRKRKGDYVIYVPLASLMAAWQLYKNGRVFKAAEELNTGVAPRYTRVSRETADALEARYPHGVWVTSGVPDGARELWIHLVIYGWEGAMAAPYEMALRPSLPGEPMVVFINTQVLGEVA
jgi:hypothetical protein